MSQPSDDDPRCQNCTGESRAHQSLYESGLVRLEIMERENARLRALVCEIADVVEGDGPNHCDGLHRLGPDLSARVESIRLEATESAREACPGSGKCHGSMDWCDRCGTVRNVCDATSCDVHGT